MKQGKDRLITFTTDFGYKDPYAAVMKGVVQAINHRVKFVDITHDIRPQNVEQAAFVIGTNFHWFPEGTIHVVVVDPGVGTDRRALVVKAAGHTFVGPDNGVFSYLFDREPLAVYNLTNKKYMLPTISRTFHGRDVFSPAAAWLSKGVKAMRMGKEITDFVTLERKRPEVSDTSVKGVVQHIDAFGNLVTNVPEHVITQHLKSFKITLGKNAINELAGSYAEGKDKDLIAIIGSSGLLEIACPNGSAAEKTGMEIGDEVVLKKQG